MNRTGVLVVNLMLASFLSSTEAPAQVCRVSVAGLNNWRRVMGPVDAECGWFHSAPFGNWGVTSNYGQKEDGRQFEGWYWTDSKYQWNSCTFHEWAPPNCSYYNWNNCTEQVQHLYGSSAMSIDVHGTIGADVYANCPEDTDDDGICDSGGCKDLYAWSSGTNWMSLYELDRPDPDDLVQTLYFPNTTAYLNCEVGWCDAAASPWVGVSWYQDPSNEQRVEAQLQMLVNYAYYVDGPNCEYLRFSNPRYNCLW